MATQRERIPLPPMAERNSTNTQGIQKASSTSRCVHMCLCGSGCVLWQAQSITGKKGKWDEPKSPPKNYKWTGDATVCVFVFMWPSCWFHNRFPPQDLKHMETLIPEEFHIVKNKGVQALECFDEWAKSPALPNPQSTPPKSLLLLTSPLSLLSKFTVLLEDDKKMLKVFPSMWVKM